MSGRMKLAIGGIIIGLILLIINPWIGLVVIAAAIAIPVGASSCSTRRSGGVSSGSRSASNSGASAAHRAVPGQLSRPGYSSASWWGYAAIPVPKSTAGIKTAHRRLLPEKNITRGGICHGRAPANHAVLYVHDLPGAVDFYTSTLGFQIRAQMGDQAAFLRAPGSANDHDLGLFAVGGVRRSPGTWPRGPGFITWRGRWARWPSLTRCGSG